MTQPFTHAALGRVESELVGILRKALALDATQRLRFAIHAAGWLHSMVLHRRIAVVAISNSNVSTSFELVFTTPFQFVAETKASELDNICL